jgi:hypothetical protein
MEIHSLRYWTIEKLFLGNQFPAEHSLCEEVTVLPRQGMEGTAVKKWHKRKNTAADTAFEHTPFTRKPVLHSSDAMLELT